MGTTALFGNMTTLGRMQFHLDVNDIIDDIICL